MTVEEYRQIELVSGDVCHAVAERYFILLRKTSAQSGIATEIYSDKPMVVAPCEREPDALLWGVGIHTITKLAKKSLR